MLQVETPGPATRKQVPSGTRHEEVYTAPPQTRALPLRQQRNGRCICGNQAFSILHRAQEGRPELIKKDGGEMLVSIVLDRPLDEAKALVEDPDRLISEISAILESKQSHPLLDQMVNPDVEMICPLHRGMRPHEEPQVAVPHDRFQCDNTCSGCYQRGRPTAWWPYSDCKDSR